MQGKIVIITGANGGLGASVTESFLAAGATVVGVSRSMKQSDVANEQFTALAADLTKAASARELVQTVLSRFGRIDVLIHGMGGFAAGLVHETEDATWQNMQDLNLTSAFHVLREVIPAMRKERYGRIVAVGSDAAEEPHAGLGAYSVFKKGLDTLVQVVAAENKEFCISANVVLPGTMDTPANRKAMPNVDPARWVQAKRVAELILSLASEPIVERTGQLIRVV